MRFSVETCPVLWVFCVLKVLVHVKVFELVIELVRKPRNVVETVVVVPTE